MARFKIPLRDKIRRVAGERPWTGFRYSAWIPPTEKLIVSKPAVSQVTNRKPPKRDTFVWQMLDVAMKENDLGLWEPQWQNRGTCVGQAWKVGCDDCAALAYVLFNKVFPGRMSVATIYAGSRVEVAGRPGWSDGSNGYWAAEFVTEWGCTTLTELGLDDDSRSEDERLAVRWCGSRAGVPASYEEMASERPVLQTPRMETIDDALVALDSGSPISIASPLIPSGSCDRNGVSRVRRRGGHNMLIRGVRWLNGDPIFLCQNSWGPNWGEVAIEGQPKGSVWITAGDLLSIFKYRDSHAIVGMGGLEPLDWLALSAAL